MAWRIPLTDVTLDDREAQAASAVLRSGWLTQGDEVAALEHEFADFTAVRHAVAVSSGTAALHLAYVAAELGPGDEFIAPALTFVATFNAGLYTGARPVAADCTSPDDLTISVDDVRRKITPHTKVIVAMAYGGFCPDLPALRELADECGAALIEDACHAPGAQLDGRAVGTFGRAGCFSLFGNKNLTTGEGGMIVTDDEALAERCRQLRSHGMTAPTLDRHRGHASDYDVTEMGWNYRMDEMRAAVGRVQLDKLPAANRRRAQAAQALRSALNARRIEGLEIPFAHPRGQAVHHLFVVLLPPRVERGAFRARLAETGIQTSVHYPLPHRFSFGASVFGEVAVPVAESIASRLVSLPMGPHLDARCIDAIADGVESACAS